MALLALVLPAATAVAPPVMLPPVSAFVTVMLLPVSTVPPVMTLPLGSVPNVPLAVPPASVAVAVSALATGAASLSRPVVLVTGALEVIVPSYFTPVPSSLMVAVPVANLVDSVLVAVPPVTVWSASVALSWNVSLLSTAASCSPVISTLTNIFPAASKVGSALVAS